ncbi:MAG: DNA primase, partial [Deltaproteobacteria bacterium]|nr:DNA primase [Deltaproteobacteria bacterium]
MISPDTLQIIKDRADILAVVGSEVRLKRAGGLYQGLCPFHQEKTPSFTVNPTQSTYHCFGCGEHGDSLKFLQKHRSLSFPDAVRALAALVGVEIVEERRGTPEQQRERKARQDRDTHLAELHAALVAHYRTALARSPQAQSYLKERGVSEEAAAAFELGWASDDVPLFYEWMTRVGASADDLADIGALRRPSAEDEPERAGRGDARLNGCALRFRGRLMCPVFDPKGRSIGFSGRVIQAHSKAPKYLNTPETPLFTKGRSLYGLKTAREACRGAAGAAAPLIVCEGNLDVVSMWQAGFKKVVAPMGTALTPEQAQLMSRLSPTVISVMDGDSAGQKAAFKSLPVLLSAGLRVRAVVLPPSEDPDSFVRAYGPREMEALIAAAQPLLTLYLHSRVAALPRDAFGQAQAAREVLPLVAMIADPYERPLFLDEVAQVVGVDRLYLTRQLDDLMRAQGSAPPRERGAAPPRPSPPSGAPPFGDLPSGGISSGGVSSGGVSSGGVSSGDLSSGDL